MATTDVETETAVRDDQDEISDFEPTRGAVRSELDVADDEHPIRAELGPSNHRKLTAHEGTLGERFAFRYGKADAFIREYLANAETGCIRRARVELREEDPDTYDSEWFETHSIPELLEESREVAGYHPVIETHHAESGANRDRFVIEDNGVGISVQEFRALSELGLSPSHDEGSQLGSFGQGVMAHFNATGRYGEATLETWSRQDNANYRMRFRITGFNDLPGKRDSYGTTWSFPAFCDDAKGLDVESAIETYTVGMFVPVIHHEYDGEGVEQYKEEYTYEPLEACISDDQPSVVYEDSDIEVVASPTIGEDSEKTYLVSMPIERADSGSRSSPFRFHIRIKNEDGRIYECSHTNDDHEGMVPIEEEHYENKLIKGRDAVHLDQLVPGDLVGYKDPRTDQFLIPRGVDDELVETQDSLTHPDEIEREAPIAEHYPSPEFGMDTYIVAGPHEGRRVVTEAQWHEMETDAVEQYVPSTEANIADDDRISKGVPNGYDIVCPTPVDDRDRLEEHNGALFELASQRIRDVYEARVKSVIETFDEDGFEAWHDLEQEDRELFVIDIKDNVDESTVTGIAVQNHISQTYDLTIDRETCEGIASLFDYVEHAPRNTHTPNKRRGRTNKPVADVLLEAGTDGDVYMGATVHPDKAALAWAIHDDNQVVAVDGSHLYDEYEGAFRWKKLKDLSLYDIADNYDVSADIIDRIERDRSDDDSSNGGGVSIDELEAKTREIKLRSRENGSYKSWTPKEIEEALENDEQIKDYKAPVDYLMVFNQTDVSGVGHGHESCIGHVSRTVVPNYVAEYLEDLDITYMVDGRDHVPVVEEIQADMATTEIETVGIDPFLDPNDDDIPDVEDDVDVDLEWEEAPVGDLGQETTVIILSSRINSILEEVDDMTDSLSVILESTVENGYVTEGTERVALVNKETVRETALCWENDALPVMPPGNEMPRLINHYKVRSPSTESDEWRPDSSLVIDLLFPKSVFDRDAPEWKDLVKRNSRQIRHGYDEGEAIVNVLHRLADVTDDDEPVFPSDT